MSAPQAIYAYGFRAYPRDAALTLDQRAYVVRMLHLGATSRSRALKRNAPGADSAAVREWRGIERACDREGARLARVARRTTCGSATA